MNNPITGGGWFLSQTGIFAPEPFEGGVGYYIFIEKRDCGVLGGMGLGFIGLGWGTGWGMGRREVGGREGKEGRGLLMVFMK